MHRGGESHLRNSIALSSLFLVGLLVLWAPCSLAVQGNGKLQIHHVSVGQGDGAVIISPHGQVVLVDEGVYSDCSPMLNYLTSLGITSVDYHFASHYHADHIGCLDDILASGVTLNIAGYDRAYSYSSATYTAYVNALGSKRRTIAKNQIITLDSTYAHPVYIKCVDLNGAGVYSPTGSDENAKSIALKISYGAFDEAMDGDLTASPSVEPTVGPEMGDVEVYKVHHHSSGTSSYDEWLNYTTPEVGIISLGSNSYGYVNSTTLTRLHNHGVKTYWTHAGSAAAPVEGWDKVGGNIVIQADYCPGAAYTVTGTGFVDTYYNSGTADVTPPLVASVTPAGGEIVYVGSEEEITWVATDNTGVDSVGIYYSTDGGSTFPYTIATGEPNDSSYTWVVPDTPSENCVIKVVAYDQCGNSGYGVSATSFRVRNVDLTPPLVTVVEPAYGETLYVSDPAQIEWIATDNVAVDSISIYYSTDGGATFPYTIATGEPNDSSYTWVVPNTPSENCVVKVVAYDPSINSGQGVSATFRIMNEQVDVGVVPVVARFELMQNVPNPFNPVTNIEFSLAQPGRATVRIYNMAGGVVKTLVDGTRPAGRQTVVWTGEDELGAPMASGVYAYVLEADGQRQVRKLVLLR